MKNNIVFITDIGKDIDDSIALNLLCKLHKNNLCNLSGVVANCGKISTLKKRVKFIHNTLLNEGVIAPICYGINIKNDDFNKELNCFNSKPVKNSYLTKIKCPIYNDSNLFFDYILNNSQDKSVTLCICAPYSEVAKYIGNNGQLFNKKIKDVVIMGNMILNNGISLPDEKSYNISLDNLSAKFVHEYLRKSNIPTYYLPSYSIKQKPVNKKFILNLTNKNYNLKSLEKQQKSSFYRHYHHALNNKNPDKNKYTIEKFLHNFTDITVVKRYKFRYVYKHITNVYLYDPYTILLCIDELKEKFFKFNYYDNFVICELLKNSKPQGYILDLLNN